MTQFQRFFWASGLANLADGVATLAWVWVASLLTRDAALIALVPMALRLPWAIFAIPAGVLADRMDRRRLVVAMDALRAVAFALAAGLCGGRGLCLKRLPRGWCRCRCSWRCVWRP